MEEHIAKLCGLKPVMASRVCEAALRACTPEAVLAGCASKHLVQFTAGLHVAAKACSPANHPRAAQLFTDTKLATRMCSLLVSCAKQLRLAMVPDYFSRHLTELTLLLDVANAVATAGHTVWTKASAELEAAASAGRQASAKRAGSAQRQQQIQQQLLAAPGLATWLAATGKALCAVAQLFTMVLAWHFAVVEQHNSATQAGCAATGIEAPMLNMVRMVTSHVSALQWLQTVLTGLLVAQQQQQQQPESGGPAAGSTAAAAAPAARNRRHPVSAASSASSATSAQSVQPAVLQELLEQLSAHRQRYQPLLDECRRAAVSSSLSDIAAAVRAFAHASSDEDGEEPDLADSLLSIGAAVMEAFPAKFGCNLPTCNNLDGMTEAASNRVCGGCKAASYCCKAHQNLHWRYHKTTCKHIKQLRRAAAAAASS